MAKRTITRVMLLQAERFTEIYQASRDMPPALREARCLAAQYPAALTPIQAQDRFAGRMQLGLVGFASKNETGFGYWCHTEELSDVMQDAERSEADRQLAARLYAYWDQERSCARTRAAFPPEMEAALPYDDLDKPGVGFPLYRMAGWVLDYDKLMRLGIPGLKKEAQQHLEVSRQAQNEEMAALYSGMVQALDVLTVCAEHYAAEIDKELEQPALEAGRAAQLGRIKTSLQAVGQHAPATMHEALQLAWLYSLVSITMDYGRMDDYIGPFYAADLAAGRITEEEAVEDLTSLWGMIADTAETVHGRVMIGGKGRKHEAEADAFALLAMEASRRVKRSIPQLSLRLYDGCNPRLLERALDVLGEGRTFPILYWDEVNVPSVQRAFGVPENEAVDYFPFGCGEYVLGHRSFGTPNGVINLLKALELAIFNGVDVLTGRQLGPQTGDSRCFASFDELYEAYLKQCAYFFEYLAWQEELEYRIAGGEASYLLQSMLYDDCMSRGKGLFSGGIRYLGGTVETYGNISTADSLYAIKTMVYDQKQVDMETLQEAMQSDFAGFEALQKKLSALPKFGNDDEAADDMAARMHQDVCRVIREQGAKTSLASYLAVLINNDHNVRLGHAIGASADGRQAWAPMSNANGPTADNDVQGITALLNSMTKLRTDVHAGSVQNMKFSKNMFREKRLMVKAILETYFASGGSQAMLTVVDRGELEQAMKEPEKYQNLFVRAGGYSGRFVSMSRDVQLDILKRTLYD